MNNKNKKRDFNYKIVNNTKIEGIFVSLHVFQEKLCCIELTFLINSFPKILLKKENGKLRSQKMVFLPVKCLRIYIICGNMQQSLLWKEKLHIQLNTRWSLRHVLFQKFQNFIWKKHQIIHWELKYI